MKKLMKSKGLCLLLCSAMLFALPGCGAGNKETPALSHETSKPTVNAESTAIPVGEINRASYEKQADKLAKRHQQAPNDQPIGLEYAEKLLQLGNLAESQKVLAPILAGKTPNPQAIYLSAQIAYLFGKYDQAEKQYNALLEQYPDEFKAKAEAGLVMTYYQTNQYQKAQALSVNNARETDIGALMRAFGDREPYKVSWADKKETTIPFRVTEPLPVVQAEVNGEVKNFILDTGASETYLSESVANAMGLKPVSTQTGEYAGGISVETNFGIVDSLKLSGVTLESIPVCIAKVDHFSAMYDFEISGVIGIGAFKQFLVTMDYINGELTLKPRGEHAQKNGASEVPFTMADTHFILCKAKVNGKEMNLFLDSGLADDESLLLPKGAMDYAGIPIPEEQHNASEDDTQVGGLGGADYATSAFTADTYQMGDLPVVNDMKGLFGVFPESLYFSENAGLFMDGIISHNYLKNYKWTIDFDSMKMTFSK